VVLALALGSATVAFTQRALNPRDVHEEMNRLDLISHAVQQLGKISDHGRAYVLSMLDSPVADVGVMATLVLGVENEYGLLPTEQLIRDLEPRLKVSLPRVAGEQFRVIASCLKLPGAFDKPVFERFHTIDGGGKEANLLMRLQRRFIEDVLSSPNLHNRLFAGELFVQRRRLPRVDRLWILNLVEGQIAHSAGKEKRVWQIVRRTVLARNAS
jgi:hypothetical protein